MTPSLDLPRSRWQRLAHHWGKDLQLWCFITLSLQLFRLLLITLFAGQIAHNSGVATYLTIFANGLRYDISTAAVWIAPTFLASLLLLVLGRDGWLTALRLWSGRLFVLSLLLLGGADLVYFDEFGDQFDQRIFGLIHDDTTAILVTIWKEYHPLLFLAAVGLAMWVMWRLVGRWLHHHPALLQHPVRLGHWGSQALSGVLLLLLFLAALRGGTLWGEPIRLKHAFIVDDLFLNRTVLNPYSALRYTIKSKLALQKGSGLKQIWPGRSINEALALHLGHSVEGGVDLDQALTRQAKGTTTPPRHIFVMLLESHSGWPLLPHYRSLGLSPELARLADRGVYFPNFLPSGSGTIISMNTLLTGLPDAGLNINYEPESFTPYPSGLATQFKRLGYTTRFFYGGSLSWQRLDSFALNQGFDEVHGGASMNGGQSTNEWGVDDKYLYDYILGEVDADKPSLNFILTTTNHPPYDLDLEALGFPVTSLPEPITATKGETMQVLGHLWYTDQQAAAFVAKMEQRLPQSLFAITGDHTARLNIRFPGDNAVEQRAVPLILYAPALLGHEGRIEPRPGSHLDLPTTLLELSAPKGFDYTGFGEDLLVPSQLGAALGYDFFIGEGYIATLNEAPRFYALTPTLAAVPPADGSGSMERFNALRALSWYRTRRGSRLPERE